MLKLHKKDKLEDILKETGAAGIIRYGQEQLEISRLTIMNWMSKIGQTQTIQLTDSTTGVTQEVECEMVNLHAKEFSNMLENAPFYKKVGKITARQADMPEIVVHKNPLEPDIIANIGDWVVQNPIIFEPYVIKDILFSAHYMPLEGEKNTYVSIGKPVKATTVVRNIAFVASWGQLQVMQAGDVIIHNSMGERYGVKQQTFYNSYEKTTHLPMRFVNREGHKEEIECRIVDLSSTYFNDAFEKAYFYKKLVEIRARQASTLELVSTFLDATHNTANPGDWIVANPGEDPYVIKANRFAELYRPKPGEEDVYISIGKPVKAIPIDEDIVFIAPWGELQAVRKGGHIIQDVEGQRYGIDALSFSQTYHQVRQMAMKFRDHTGKDAVVQCDLVDLSTSYYVQLFAQSPMYKKITEVWARQAQKMEIISTELDATQNTANPGDWIVSNPGEKPYIIREDRFAKMYKPKEGDPGLYVSVSKPVHCVRTDKDIVFIAPWRELQAVRAGGYILENMEGERYSISEKSFKDTYQPC